MHWDGSSWDGHPEQELGGMEVVGIDEMYRLAWGRGNACLVIIRTSASRK